MSKRILTYNGINLSTFNAHVSGEGAWVKPAPEFERISVPGRSGDVLLYNGRYSNVDITYRFGITNNFDTNYTNLIAALLGSPGYHKLVDSKHPGVYRMAAVDKVIDPVMSQQLSVGEFDVTFNCKPQIYLDSGEDPELMWSRSTDISSSITNPTGFAAYPLIKITMQTYNPGSFTISFTGEIYYSIYFNEKLTTGTFSGVITCDPENGDVYDGNGKSLNEYAEINKFSIPANGIMGISLSSNAKAVVNKVEVIPRWWKL